MTDRDGIERGDGMGESGFTRDRITVSCLVIWTAAATATARTATQGVWGHNLLICFGSGRIGGDGV